MGEPHPDSTTIERLRGNLLIVDGLVKAADIAAAEFLLRPDDSGAAAHGVLAALRHYTADSLALADDLIN